MKKLVSILAIMVALFTSNQAFAQRCFADFTFLPDSTNKLKIYFTNKSGGSSTAQYFWSFGDGTSSNSNSPTHTYTMGKTYTVCLIIKDTFTKCSDTICKSVVLGCSAPFGYSVTGSTMSYKSGLTGVSYRWDFGDGSTGNSYSGSHTYAKAGTYKVCLTRYCSSTDSATECQTITIANQCKASFSAYVDSARKYRLYLLNQSSNSSGTTYKWTFGDGGTSTSRNPTHKYATYGKYQICLTVSIPGTTCSSTYCDTIGLDSSGRMLKADGFELEVVDALAGAKDVVNTGVKLYPNPTTGKVNINLSDASIQFETVEIINVQGVVCMKKQIAAGELNLELNIDQFNSGLYFVRLSNATSTTNMRLLKN